MGCLLLLLLSCLQMMAFWIYLAERKARASQGERKRRAPKKRQTAGYTCLLILLAGFLSLLGEAPPNDKTGFALGTRRRRTGDVLRQEHRLVCSRDEDRKGHRPKADRRAARKTTRRSQVMYETALGLYRGLVAKNPAGRRDFRRAETK